MNTPMNTMNIMNNSYLQIDLDILKDNVQTILSSLPESCQLIPVLKDDAYGLGLVPVARALCRFPQICCLAVAHVSEGLTLRGAGIEQDILVMSSPLPFQLEAAILTHLTLCASGLDTAKQINAAAAALGLCVKVQIKLDIGLHRIGMDVEEELDAFLSAAPGLRNLTFSGVFSHFSHAGDDALCRMQYARFEKGVEKLSAAGLNTFPRHISCSATSEYYPCYSLDAVRIGRRLYMDSPDHPDGSIRELASWRSYVTAVKPRRAGERIGYGDGLPLENDCLVATVGVGYGDGLDPRLCQAHAPVLINGVPCPLLVCCMDQCMVDVSAVNCAAGDEVTFFGYDRQGNLLSSQAAANLVGANEGCAFTSALSPRVARVYSE